MKKIVAVLLCLLLLLNNGCSQQPDAKGKMGSQIWEEAQKLDYGRMDTTALKPVSWDSGRCEETSQYAMAETEKGYYIVLSGYLHYIDKLSGENWVYVCNQPQCTHAEDINTCNAWLSSRSIVIHNNKIFYSQEATQHPQLYAGEGNGRILMSMAADGTDKKHAYTIDEAMVDSAGNAGSSGSAFESLNGRGWLYLSTEIDTKGASVTRLFYLTSEGLHTIAETTESENASTAYMMPSGLNGESVFYFSNFMPEGSGYYQLEEGTFIKKELPAEELTGAYFAGNVIRYFESGYGYYDVDITTGEETYLAAARLKNSKATILLPNCVVETTLGSPTHPAGEEHALEIFDGEQWHRVTLPEELQYGKNLTFFSPVSVASDCILFIYQGENERFCYQVKLGQENWVLEPFGQVS